MKTEIGKFLAKHRIDNDIKARDMAIGFGISQQHLSNIERGVRPLSVKMAADIIDSLGLISGLYQAIAVTVERQFDKKKTEFADDLRKLTARNKKG